MYPPHWPPQAAAARSAPEHNLSVTEHITSVIDKWDKSYALRILRTQSQRLMPYTTCV